jgi:Flp pilus assembly protein TadG
VAEARTTREQQRIAVAVCSHEAGQEIAEAAVVMPILCLVLLAIFWFGRAFNIASTVERAAKHGIQTTDQTCATCGNNTPTDAQIVANISTALQNDHLNTANLTSYSPPFACQASPAPTCTTSQNVRICRNVPLTCGAANCQNPPVACGADPNLGGVRVSFGYRFTSPLPIARIPAITLHASAVSPLEN